MVQVQAQSRYQQQQKVNGFMVLERPCGQQHSRERRQAPVSGPQCLVSTLICLGGIVWGSFASRATLGENSSIAVVGETGSPTGVGLRLCMWKSNCSSAAVA